MYPDRNWLEQLAAHSDERSGPPVDGRARRTRARHARDHRDAPVVSP